MDKRSHKTGKTRGGEECRGSLQYTYGQLRKNYHFKKQRLLNLLSFHAASTIELINEVPALPHRCTVEIENHNMCLDEIWFYRKLSETGPALTTFVSRLKRWKFRRRASGNCDHDHRINESCSIFLLSMNLLRAKPYCANWRQPAH